MYDPEKSALFECRECGVISSDNCCNAGRGTLCFDCEEVLQEEEFEDDDD
jgi:hypothetical protein